MDRRVDLPDEYEDLNSDEDILRGLEEPDPPIRRRRRRGATGGYIAATIFTTPSTISVPDTLSVGTTVATVGISGGYGAYTLSFSDPSGQFTLVGSSIQVAATLSIGTYPVTISGSNGLGDNPVLHTSIIVTSPTGYVPTYPFFGF